MSGSDAEREAVVPTSSTDGGWCRDGRSTPSSTTGTGGRGEAHRARLAPYVEPHLARRRAGEKHPVHDFLFTYYSFSPAKLLDWQPGWPSSGSPELVAKRRPLVSATRDLLSATAARTPAFACFGLHEWAMVHRANRTRHPVPLRLGAAGTDEVVESHRIACSHFDAYRFFTPSAVPLNSLRPGRDDRPAYEQPGCLHGTMDLYKHAFRLWPLIGSDLVADCFVLAWDVRDVDMRAAPYDLTAWGFEPIRIETPEGKQEYAAHQRSFATRSAGLRERLVDVCDRALPADRACRPSALMEPDPFQLSRRCRGRTGAPPDRA
jgi:hypothetical protein